MSMSRLRTWGCRSDSDAPAELIGGAQALAAGAVLAVVSISIIPHAFEEVSLRVVIAMVLGSWRAHLLSLASLASWDHTEFPSRVSPAPSQSSNPPAYRRTLL
jgi:hypothetical protein